MDFRVACASDFHFPIADSKAVDWFLSEAERFEANVIVLNGDLLEGKDASRHDKDSRQGWSLKDELDALENFFNEINRRFPLADKVWLYGNHDDNVLNYNTGRLPKEITEIISEYKDIRLKESTEGWYVIDSYKHDDCWYLGQLCFRHGFDISQAGIIKDLADYTPYAGLLCFGHTHRPIPVTQRKTNQVLERFWYANTGAMLDPDKAHYMDRLRKTQWGQGMLLAETTLPSLRHGRIHHDEPKWKACVKIRKMLSQNWFDVSLTA